MKVPYIDPQSILVQETQLKEQDLQLKQYGGFILFVLQVVIVIE
jgi:hypothetical protein